MIIKVVRKWQKYNDFSKKLTKTVQYKNKIGYMKKNLTLLVTVFLIQIVLKMLKRVLNNNDNDNVNNNSND